MTAFACAGSPPRRASAIYSRIKRTDSAASRKDAFKPGRRPRAADGGVDCSSRRRRRCSSLLVVVVVVRQNLPTCCIALRSGYLSRRIVDDLVRRGEPARSYRRRFKERRALVVRFARAGGGSGGSVRWSFVDSTAVVVRCCCSAVRWRVGCSAAALSYDAASFASRVFYVFSYHCVPSSLKNCVSDSSKTITSLSGGSLGSRVDEERSQLREVM